MNLYQTRTMPIDYKRYPKNWKEIRERILKRANNKCELCGLENHTTVWRVPVRIRDENGRYKQVGLWFKTMGDVLRNFPSGYSVFSAKVVLTIAHLDHDETNHNVTDDRLKALCQKCHLMYDAKEKYRRINQRCNKTE